MTTPETVGDEAAEPVAAHPAAGAGPPLTAGPSGHSEPATQPIAPAESDQAGGLGEAIGAVTAGGARQLAGAAKAIKASMRGAGARSVSSGRWLADAVLDVAAHLPVRDLKTLQSHHDGLAGRPLADALIRKSAQATAGLGAAAGAVAAVEEFAPPAWLAIPAELMVEILAVVAVEMKLVAELHEVYGQPIKGTPAERALAVSRAWAERRGVTPMMLVKPGGVAAVVSGTARREVSRLIRRRLARRTVRSVWTLAPMLVGAAAAAHLNQKATRSLGGEVRDDLEKSTGT